MSDGIFKKLYAVLGLRETAGDDELRRAYLALAVKHHPDRNPGDPTAEARFKEISEAYAILTDPAARGRYARMMRAGGQNSEKSSNASSTGEQRGRQSPAENGSAGGREKHSEQSESSEPDFEEIWTSFFKSVKGQDILKDLAGELKKAGFSFKVDDFAGWLKNKQRVSEAKGKNGGKRHFWQIILAIIPGTEAHARKGLAHYDLSYCLAIGAREAKTGITLEINHQIAAENPEKLVVQLPADIKDGECFKIFEKGHVKPDYSRGALIITVRIQ